MCIGDDNVFQSLSNSASSSLSETEVNYIKCNGDNEILNVSEPKLLKDFDKNPSIAPASPTPNDQQSEEYRNHYLIQAFILILVWSSVHRLT